MVAWLWCPSCGKVVDEFENECHWCKSKEGPRQLEKYQKREEREEDRGDR